MQKVCSSGKVDDIIYTIIKDDGIVNGTITDHNKIIESTHVTYELAFKWVDDYIKKHIYNKIDGIT
jgi:hypothetical protein